MREYLDSALFRWLNSWVGISYFGDGEIIFLATYLWFIVMLAVVVFVMATWSPRFRAYSRRNAEFFILALVSAISARFVVTELIRWFYNRPRPFEVLEGARQLVGHDVGGSFPSGHASLAFAIATAVSFYYPKTSILFFLAAVSIGFGRVAAGVHWPSDILGGALVGIGAAWLIKVVYGKFKKSDR